MSAPLGPSRRQWFAPASQIDSGTVMDLLKQMKALYDELPKLICKGLCAASCQTVIDMSDLERHRVEGAAGLRLPLWVKEIPGHVCPLLTDENDCSVYAVRPMICRLWGLSKSPKMRCDHGCEPDRWLPDVEILERLMRSYEIGGKPVGVDVAATRACMAIPEIAVYVPAILAGDYSAAPEIQRLLAVHRAAIQEQLASQAAT